MVCRIRVTVWGGCTGLGNRIGEFEDTWLAQVQLKQ